MGGGRWDLDSYVSQKILVPGVANVLQRPGSAVVFLNEEAHRTRWGLQFARRFACEGWTSPTNKYKVVMANGTCYLDWA